MLDGRRCTVRSAEVVRLPVHHRGKIVAHALVDDDMAHLAFYRWTIKTPKGYVRRFTTRGEKSITLYLHRVVMGVEGEMEVDHKDRNPLDCRRGNLEVVTKAVNVARGNRGTYRGAIKKRMTSETAQHRLEAKLLAPVVGLVSIPLLER